MSNRVVPEFTRQRYLQTLVSIEVEGVWLDAVAAVAELPTPVYVITAFNPDGRRLPMRENQSRNEQLHDQLMADHLDVRPAVGASPDRRWAEASWAVIGIGRRKARRLGRKWGQDAIFELTHAEQVVLGCGTSWSRARPLVGHVEPDDGFDLAEAVADTLGIEVEPGFRRAFERGWSHDGDLQVPCPGCGGALHLFGVDLESTTGTDYRAMAFVCPSEGSVRRPGGVPADYRALAKAWRHWVLASRDADDRGLTERTNWTYVIELSDDAGERDGADRPWLYVGETGLTPEVRFANHLAGYKASRWVRKFGLRLRSDLYEDQPVLRTKAESVAYEAWLFAFLRATGNPVKGGT